MTDTPMLVRKIVSRDECARCRKPACFEVMVPWKVFKKYGNDAIRNERVEYLGTSWARFVTCLGCRDDLFDGAAALR